MWWIGYLLALVQVAGVRSENAIADGVQNFLRAHFERSEKFATTSHLVLHMELDLYKDDGSILFTDGPELRTTNGKSSTVVSSGFKYLFGFKQINSTHIAVAERNDDCVWMVNRAGNPTKKLLAGTCGLRGYVDGKPGKFNHLWSIELDERNPGHLLVADHHNNALRSIEIETGILSTAVRSGLNLPIAMAWNNDRLLVTNIDYISEVSWDKNGSVTNTRITGSTSAGFMDGYYSVSLFDNPFDITLIQDHHYLIADASNNRIRLLDLRHQRVSSACIGSAAPCTDGTAISDPSSILKTGDAVYVGTNRLITKLTGYQCYAQKNVTAYVNSDKERANVRLMSDDVAVFPVGEYEFRRKYGANNCIFYLNVLVAPINRIAAFQTTYDVTCTNLESKPSKVFLQSVLAHKNEELKKLCGQECRMSGKIQPWYTCGNNTLTVTWPTDDAFPADVKTVPSTLYRSMRKVVEASTLRSFELPMLSHIPPLVSPIRDQNGETVQIVLTTTCTQKNQQHQKNSDTCV